MKKGVFLFFKNICKYNIMIFDGLGIEKVNRFTFLFKLNRIWLSWYFFTYFGSKRKSVGFQCKVREKYQCDHIIPFNSKAKLEINSLDWKNYSDQAYRCLRGWRLSASWMTHWGQSLKPFTITVLWYRGIQGQPTIKSPFHKSPVNTMRKLYFQFLSN